MSRRVWEWWGILRGVHVKGVNFGGFMLGDNEVAGIVERERERERVQQ